MEWIETTGKSIEEARELALDQLGVDERETEFEIIDEPKVGLFGRTRGVARVRARIIPKSPRSKTDRKRRPKKRADGEGSSHSGESNGKRSESGDTSRSGSESRRPSRSGKQDGGPSDTVAASTGAESSAGPKLTASDANDNRERKPKAATKTRNEDRSPDRGKEPMDEQEQIHVVEEFLKELGNGFGLEVAVSSEFDDEDLYTNLTGDGLGMLVGPRLATLEAIQEVARNALQRQAAGRGYARLTVDVDGIRRRRREALTEFVTEAAQTAKDGSSVAFEVMSSADRKLVHDVAGDIDGVSSVSEGEDPRRRVVLRSAQ